MSDSAWSVVNSRKFSQLVRDHRTWLKTSGRKGKQLVLSRAVLSFIKLAKVDLSKASLLEVDFSHLASITNVQFNNSKLERCCFYGAELEAVDFSCAECNSVNFRDSTFRDCVFLRSVVNLSDFAYCYWVNTTCRDSAFTGSSFIQNSFNNTNILANSLSGANLAEVRFCNLSEAQCKFCRLDFGGWSVFITPTHTQIGCQRHPNKTWLEWDYRDAAIKSMHHRASCWWKQYGPVVKAAILSMSARSRRRKTK